MRFSLLVIFFFLLHLQVWAQCPEPTLYDINFTRAVSDPTWVNCIDNSSDPDEFNLSFVSPNDIHNYILDFGDGSAPATGDLWEANTAIVHDFPLGRFTVTLSETRNGCTTTITGEVVNDRKAGATAIPPTIGTSGCVPHTLTFINNSANTSAFTRFEWNWGDGTREEQDASSVGQPTSHVFEKGKAGCDMVVNLWAYSMCDTTFSSYGPYDFWDIDTAVVAASATRICGGQDITFTDQTLYNCNVKQPRKILWDFTEVGGPVTDWLPATPENRSQTYFVTGNVGDKFTVYMLDSNFCGVDPAAVTVEIVGPPQAEIQAYDTVICAGETARFKNLSTGDADIYYWDFGNGTTGYSTGTKQDVARKYNEPGQYVVKLIAAVSGTELCRDTTEQIITVLPSSVSVFSLDKNSGCSPVTVNITESSSNAVEWTWDFGSLGTFTGKNPNPLTITDPGSYQVTLETVNSLGCGSKQTATISVYPSVFASATVDSVCFGVPVNFAENSTLEGASSCAEGSILHEQWNEISGSDVGSLTGHASFQNPPSSSSLLDIFEAPNNSGNNYGSRIRGFICPPQTGNYVFWIASDDNSELWLSSDANPVNRTLIASVSGFTSSRQWTKFTSQQSVPVYLVAGTRYYIEALHKEGTGGDNLAVGWELPSGARERPIPGTRLSPYSEGSVINSWTWDFGDGTGSSDREPAYTYSASGEYQVKLVASTGKCADTVTYPLVIFPPVRAKFSLSDTAGCTPLALDIYNEAEGGQDFIWSFGDGSPVYNSDVSSPDTLSHVFINNSGEDQIFYLSQVARSGEGCSDTLFRKVKVYPGPTASFSFKPEVPKCSPVTVEFTNNSSSADHYEWHIGRRDTLFHSEQQFNYEFLNKSASISYDTISLRAYSSTGCYGEATKVVTVFPEPELEIVADPDTGCHPLAVNFSITGGASSFQWLFGDGNTSLAPTPQHVFQNESAKDTTFTVKYTGASAFGCRDTAYAPVLVYPNPQALMINDVSAGCSPLTVNFTDLSSGASEVLWIFGDGESAAGEDSLMSHTFINESNEPVTFTTVLIVKNQFGCMDSVAREITVYPKPRADFVLSDTSGCSPLKVAANNTSSGGFAYMWDFGNGQQSSVHSPSHTYTSSKKSDTSFVITLTVTSENGCSDNAVDTVTIFGLPVASFTTSVPAGCSPLEVDFTNTSTNYSTASWTIPGEGAPSDAMDTFTYVFENKSSAAIKYPVNMTAVSEHGCKDHTMKQVTVYPAVTADIASTDTAGCSPWDVRFFNISGGAGSAVWDFGDGTRSASTSVNHTFLNNSVEKDTSYTVTLYASNSYGCSDTAKKQILVFPVPAAEFLKDAVAGCSPLNINFLNISRGGDTYVWDFGGTDAEEIAADSVSYLFDNTGRASEEYKVQLTATNTFGCSSKYSSDILVYPKVLAEITADSIGCSPFKSQMTYIGAGAESYRWDFGDGDISREKAPTHTFFNASNHIDTVFKVSLIASSTFGCADTAYIPVRVLPLPHAELSKDITESCSPVDVDLTNLSRGGTEYIWNFGNGTTINSNDDFLTYTFENSSDLPREYSITLTASNNYGCSSDYTSKITVNPAVVASFASNPAGCAPVKVNVDYTGQGADQFHWEFGDGETSSAVEPVHTYQNFGSTDTSFTISLVASSSYGCSDTASASVAVYAQPVAGFTASPGEIILPDSAIALFNTSSPGEWTYFWNFGDGSTGDTREPGNHYYGSAGTYEIRLIASGRYCSDTANRTVLVHPSVPTASFEGSGEGCQPLTIQFNNTSLFAGEYLWSFGDGETSTLPDPEHIYKHPGTYTVTLKVTGPGGEHEIVKEDIVKVYAVPSAFFKVKPDSKVVKIPGNPHYFANLSENASFYHWDLGDGSTSAEKSPFHEYTSPGEYDVTLTATSEEGCTNTYTEQGAAIAEPGGKMIVPNAFTPSGGGNLNSAGKNDVFYPLSEGVATFHMMIFNRWGELIYESKQVNQGWDGYYRGQLCKQDVYVYKIQATFIDGESVELVGDVTLIR